MAREKSGRIDGYQPKKQDERKGRLNPPSRGSGVKKPDQPKKNN